VKNTGTVYILGLFPAEALPTI